MRFLNFDFKKKSINVHLIRDQIKINYTTIFAIISKENVARFFCLFS